MKVNEVIKKYEEAAASSRANKGAEIEVMQAMLNDKEFVVNVYQSGSGEPTSTVNPRANAVQLASSIIQSTGISKDESQSLAENIEFDKKSAEAVVNISKDFLATYLPIGKKFEIAGEKLNVGLTFKHVEEKTSIIAPGSMCNKTDKPIEKVTPAYNTLKVSAKK